MESSSEKSGVVRNVPLRMLVEKIIEKKSISMDEQRRVNVIAGRIGAFDSSDFEAISRLTELICAGEVSVEGTDEQVAKKPSS